MRRSYQVKFFAAIDLGKLLDYGDICSAAPAERAAHSAFNGRYGIACLDELAFQKAVPLPSLPGIFDPSFRLAHQALVVPLEP
jgi:hypothetical protein